MQNKKQEPSTHENFKLGQGYGSGEKGSEFQGHASAKHQYGDNPLPKSGGNYKKSSEAQPKQAPVREGAPIKKEQKDKTHSKHHP